MTSNEAELQEAIADAFWDEGIPYEREVRLSAEDRPDFVVRDGDQNIAVEVKVDGSLAALTRQLHRYAQHDEADALVVVTSRARLRAVPSTLNGKPVRVVSLMGGAL